MILSSSFSKKSLVSLFVFLVVASGVFFGTVQEASAQVVSSLVGTQVGSTWKPGPWGCNRSPYQFWGTMQYASNITGTWSNLAQKAPCLEAILWVSNMGQQDFFERFKLYLANKPIPPETDIRVCVQEKNGSYGPETCTDWASTGVTDQWLDSGFSGGGNDPDGIRVKVDSRPMPGRSILDMQLRGRYQDEYWPYGNVVGAWVETPWRGAGGGWTGNITAAGSGAGAWGPANNVEIGVRYKLTALPPVALPDFQGTIGNLGTVARGQSSSISYSVLNTGAATSTAGTRVQLQFDYKRDGFDGCGVDGDLCTNATAGVIRPAGVENLSASHTFSTAGNWAVRTVADPDPSQISESNELNNMSAWDDFVVTDTPPVATLYVRSQTAGIDWTTADSVTIPAGNQIQIKWDSTAQSCQGSNFNTNGAANNTVGVSPTQQPSEGNPVTYRLLNCVDSNGLQANPDQTVVQVVAAAPALTAESTTVRADEPFDLQWNLNGNPAAECVITGPGSKVATMGTITTNEGMTQIDAAVAGAATYTLDCPGGEDTLTIQVLPQVFES